jgi:hypothetical protein
MPVKSLRKQIIGLALILGSSTLLAQPTPDPAPVEKKSPAGASILRLSVEEMNGRLPALIIKADEDVKIVLVLQLKARKEKDVIKLTCINDKLLQIRALRNTMDREKSAFDGAAASIETQQEVFTDLSTHSADIHVLREQAQVCAGEGELKTDSSGEWTGPDIPDDPGRDIFPDGVEEPGYASPYN